MRSVIIVAGGSGSRMKSEIPKQFLEINGKPVIIWTIERFIFFDPQILIVLVLPESHLLFWHDLVKKFPVAKKVNITTGGSSRYHSVINGLSHIPHESYVGIHDAVRPLVSMATLERCYSEVEKSGSAVPVCNSEDTLRIIEKKGSAVLNRELIKRVQTPQVFLAEKIITAYENCINQKHTDDASVYESYFGDVTLVEGNKENMKITYPSDILFAEALLGKV